MKKTAWDIWNVYEDVNTAFLALSESPGNMSVNTRAKLDRYTILLYDRNNSQEDIDEAHYSMYMKKEEPWKKFHLLKCSDST